MKRSDFRYKKIDTKTPSQWRKWITEPKDEKTRAGLWESWLMRDGEPRINCLLYPFNLVFINKNWTIFYLL